MLPQCSLSRRLLSKSPVIVGVQWGWRCLYIYTRLSNHSPGLLGRISAFLFSLSAAFFCLLVLSFGADRGLKVLLHLWHLLRLLIGLTIPKVPQRIQFLKTGHSGHLLLCVCMGYLRLLIQPKRTLIDDLAHLQMPKESHQSQSL